jgi:protein-S-isoprenylcysteine O-methyltransferase Ste14
VGAAGILIVAVWLVWGLQFAILLPRKRGVAIRKDASARQGMVLEAVAYCAVYAHGPRFWLSPAPVGRVAAGVVCAVMAFYVSWNEIGHLGRQWRVDAGLNDDHKLVVSGAYRYVRHPIYASMLLLMTMSIALVGTFPGAVIGVVLFIAGTEIRVRAEDRLLGERFGETFVAWQRRVPAYLPFVR